jgi:uncharacterized membrane protein SirB2
MKIGPFVLTRDSALWFWTKLVGVAALVAGGIIKPEKLGFSERWSHLVMVGAAGILYLAGQLSTSALPGKAQP